MPQPLSVVAHVDLRYTTRRPTGVDKHIARMVRGLAGRPGFAVSVLAPRGQLERQPGAASAAPQFAIPASSSLAGLPVHALPLSNRASRMLWAVSPWPAAERFTGPVDWIYSPQELWAPARRARTAVTIHGITYFEQALPGRDSAWGRFERSRLAWFFRQVCRQADLVLPVSRHVESFLIDRFGLDPAKSVVVGNGVDTCFFEAGAVPPGGAGYDPNRLLVVGGLNDWDGAAQVIAVADALARELPEMAIDVVGTLDEPRYVAAADRRRNMRRIGYVESAALAHMMPGYLALLYLPAVESFGLVGVEAMAAGLPVIACTSTAVPEITGPAALEVDAADPRAILAAIRRLRGDEAERAAWRVRGRAHAARHTWPVCLDRLTGALLEGERRA